MKVTCDIINDLIPSYIDNVCSEDSRKLVEEHIKHCPKCAKELEYMKSPMDFPVLKEDGKSKDPFLKIRKKVRIRIGVSIIITCLLMILAMFSIQEIGVLHDYFYPMSEAVIDNETDQEGWSSVSIEDSDFLNFSSIFYDKKVVNDANSSGYVTIRILDENENIILDETTIKPGDSISLKFLKDHKNYIVQSKCKEGRYFLNFV